jgi:hypothetical protein
LQTSFRTGILSCLLHKTISQNMFGTSTVDGVCLSN